MVGNMSDNASPNDEDVEPLQLGHLSGAVLTYKDASGDRVEVHFDE